MLKAGSGQRLRIWSAACSSGQEPYSLSMAIDEYERSNPESAKDGHPDRRNGAVRGNAGSVQSGGVRQPGDCPWVVLGSPAALLRCQAPGRWAVKPAIRSRVEFRVQNLLDSYAALGKFDIVFCRNVLIYFSADVKKDILKRIHATLRPGGYLFLGASEALNGLPELYQMIQCSPGIIYKAK